MIAIDQAAISVRGSDLDVMIEISFAMDVIAQSIANKMPNAHPSEVMNDMVLSATQGEYEIRKVEPQEDDIGVEDVDGR